MSYIIVISKSYAYDYCFSICVSLCVGVCLLVSSLKNSFIREADCGAIPLGIQLEVGARLLNSVQHYWGQLANAWIVQRRHDVEEACLGVVSRSICWGCIVFGK